MFKRHSLEVKVVKTPKHNTPTSLTVYERPRKSPEEIAKIVLENAKPIVIAIFAGVAALKVVDAGCEIAVNIAPKR